MACHSRAAHDHRLDTVLVPQLSADVEDAAERLFAIAVSATDISSGRSPASLSLSPIWKRYRVCLAMEG
jgi:hypothetical protein